MSIQADLFTLRQMKNRYPFTEEELKAIDFTIAELSDRVQVEEDRKRMAEVTGHEVEPGPYMAAYEYGRHIGCQDYATKLYIMGKETGTKLGRRKK